MRDKSFLQAKLAELKIEYRRLKVEVGTKKLYCNGTFGKLGSPYSAFYSPDLMLAVTLTGQLNLACLIYDLEFNPNIKVLSANTDGIMVQYPARLRDKVLRKIAENAERTGFEYEETCYSKVAVANVNNYVTLTSGLDHALISHSGKVSFEKGEAGKAKRKGLYAAISLMKNPTNSVCSNMAVDYLTSGTHPSVSIEKYTDIRDFVAIRVVKGGGVVYDRMEEVDDWVQVADREWRRQEWIDTGSTRASVKRVSRPKPVEVGIGGTRFGRIARWYMSTDAGLPINYLGSGNKVPKTDGAKLCMNLPSSLPADIDKQWYINETISMLSDMGVTV